MERKNLLIGTLWIVLFLALGLFLQLKPAAGKDWSSELDWLRSNVRLIWRSAHIHGIAFGALNILMGLMIKILELKGDRAALASLLALVGALLFPTATFFASFYRKIAGLTVIGAVSMIIAWAILYFEIKGKV